MCLLFYLFIYLCIYFLWVTSKFISNRLTAWGRMHKSSNWLHLKSETKVHCLVTPPCLCQPRKLSRREISVTPMHGHTLLKPHNTLAFCASCLPMFSYFTLQFYVFSWHHFFFLYHLIFYITDFFFFLCLLSLFIGLVFSSFFSHFFFLRHPFHHFSFPSFWDVIFISFLSHVYFYIRWKLLGFYWVKSSISKQNFT